MGEARWRAARADGITRIVFGDLFLEDVRAYRERQLAGSGIAPEFPLWGSDTAALAARMIAVGPRGDGRLRRSAAAARVLRRRGDSTPRSSRICRQGVDPCGENGEFHTCVTGGPMFRGPARRRGRRGRRRATASSSPTSRRVGSGGVKRPARSSRSCPSATEIVAALGFADALVGRSHECDFPAEVERPSGLHRGEGRSARRLGRDSPLGERAARARRFRSTGWMPSGCARSRRPTS